MPIERHPSRDREYLESQIAKGHEVVVEGKLYNRSNAKQLPSQAELDGVAAGPLSGRSAAKPKPPATTKPGENQPPEKPGEQQPPEKPGEQQPPEKPGEDVPPTKPVAGRSGK